MFDSLRKITNTIRGNLRNRKNCHDRLRLSNTDFSVVSSNCNGGCICHDLDMRFNSPFVNMWIKPKDYIKLLSNLDYYLNCDLHFVSEDNISYPIGSLDDIRLYMMHYKTEEEALTKWNERKSRLNTNNLFILFAERDGCTYSDLQEFDALPYKNKIVFTRVKYPEIKSSYHIRGFENCEELGLCSSFKYHILPYKYYDDFDYVKWFNGEYSSK